MISLFDLPAFLGVDFEEESHNVNDVRQQRSDDRQFGRSLHAELFRVVLLQMLLQRGSERERENEEPRGKGVVYNCQVIAFVCACAVSVAKRF